MSAHEPAYEVCAAYVRPGDRLADWPNFVVGAVVPDGSMVSIYPRSTARPGEINRNIEKRCAANAIVRLTERGL
jgi:hypothetical protein